MNKEIKKYLEIQDIALDVLQEIKGYIVAGVTEKDIAIQCDKLLKKAGIVDCLYHGVTAPCIGWATHDSFSIWPQLSSNRCYRKRL
jgi:methionine aminopeptidase